MSEGAPKKCLLFSQNSHSFIRAFDLLYYLFQNARTCLDDCDRITSIYPLRLIEQEEIREIERRRWHKGRYTPVYLLSFIKEGKWEVWRMLTNLKFAQNIFFFFFDGLSERQLIFRKEVDEHNNLCFGILQKEFQMKFQKEHFIINQISALLQPYNTTLNM